MTQELTALVLAILLGFAHLFAAGNAGRQSRGFKWNAGPRDATVPPLTGVAGRLDRAFRNYLETFAFFAAAALIAHLANRHNALTVNGAWLYLIARVIYLPLYAAGIPMIRSLVWLAAVGGIFMILAGLYFP
ncbi:MAG: MAPEG family protein [Xanthobacteraceae bacterium]|nr:MAPEG family protein [Xanthobacteraceae bacterium]